MKAIFIFLLVLLLSSCEQHFDEQEFCGYYVPESYQNNFDTIHFKPHGIYHRKTYDKNHTLVLCMNGNWEFADQGTRVRIHSFFLNLDDDLVKFPQTVNDTTMVMITAHKRGRHTIKFCTGYLYGTNCYHKIK